LSERNIIVKLLLCLKSRFVVVPGFIVPAVINLLIVTHLTPNTFDVIKITVTAFSISYAVYWFNDYTDLKDDLKNKELGNYGPASRPYGSGIVTGNELLTFIVLFAGVGLIVSYFINVKVLLANLTFLILGYLYSAEPLKLKRRFVWKNVVTTLGVLVIGLSGAFVTGELLPMNLFYAFINLLIYLTQPAVLDIRDISGDEAVGVKSFPVVLGPEFTVRFALMTSIAIILSAYVGYYNFGLSYAVPILVSIIMSAWIIAIYPLITKWSDPLLVDKICMKRLAPLLLIMHLVPIIGILF
jgi:4-hydroxybenzoate polyprenyltransferase